VLAVCLAAFGARLAALLRSPEPLGTDGYYYVVQVERLLATGRLHAPDGSWVLWLLAGVARLVGDPVAGVKVGAALLAAACVPAAAVAGGALARGAGSEGRAPLAGAALAAWAASSPTLGQLAAEFPKTLGLVAPALLAIGLARARPGVPRGLLLAAALLAAATAHRLGAALLGLAALGLAAGALARRASPRAALGLVLAVAGAGAAFAAATWALPNLLHPADLERLAGQLRLAPGWPSPFGYLAARRFSPAQAVELAAAWIPLALAAWAFLRRPEARPALGALALPLAVCLVPPWRDDVLDVGYRLALVAPVLAAPLLVLAWPAGRTAAAPEARRARAPASVAVAALLVAWPAARAGIDPDAHPPWDRFRRLVAALPRPLPDLLVAHQGLAFLYDHETGRDAMSWAPEPDLERRAVGRIAWGIRPGEWAEWAPRLADAPVVPLAPGYAYVREDVWEAFVARARAEGDDDLAERLDDWRNPGRVRPRSLARNHAP
jgi:hypothetical protein